MARSTIVISHRALKGRINRALVHERPQLRADRRGGVIKQSAHRHQDAQRGGDGRRSSDARRRLGVLQPWEKATP
jgi:hypothetical protein